MKRLSVDFFVGVRIEFNVSPGGLVVEFLGGFRHLIMNKKHRKADNRT